METKMQIDRIRGSLVGGAIGDALGYPVEFIPSFKEIQAKYVERGMPRTRGGLLCRASVRLTWNGTTHSWECGASVSRSAG